MLRPVDDADANMMYFRGEQPGKAALFVKTESGGLLIEVISYFDSKQEVTDRITIPAASMKRVMDWYERSI